MAHDKINSGRTGLDALSEPQSGYFVTLGRRWDRFWFSPRDAFGLSVLRILFGALAFYWLITWTPDLAAFFGPQGLTPPDVVNQLATIDQLPPARLSYLSWMNSATELYVVHALGLIVVGLFTAGAFTRITGPLTLVVVLSYLHRGMLLNGQAEPVLAIMLFYLCLGPAGRCLSFDRCRADKRRAGKLAEEETDSSWGANVAIRLMQLHLTLFYAVMALSQITIFYPLGQQQGMSITWLDGSALWWLIARPDSRLVDFTALGGYPVLVNLWTHLVLLFEIAFATLIWNRSVRPVLLALSAPVWLSLALVSGLGMFAAVMAVAGVAFLSPVQLRSWLACCTPKSEKTPAAA